MLIIVAITIGVFIFALIGVGSHLSDRCGKGFGTGIFIGIVITILMVLEICVVSRIIEKPNPSALDVYRGNTELEIASINGIPIDTVVVFKKNNNNYGTQNKLRNK